MSKRFLSFFIVAVGILLATVAIIYVAKGYRFDQTTGFIKGTGIIAVASVPQGAAIYIDGQLISASNNTISGLDPGTYKLTVSKEGFSTWEKEVIVEAEKVVLLDITLFPNATELKPLTFTGVESPLLSPDGQRVVYSSTEASKAGLWILDVSARPFTFSREPKQIAKDSSTFAYSKSTFSWAPDSRTILVSGNLNSGKAVSYLLGVDNLNENPSDVTATLNQTKTGWKKDLDLKNESLLSRLPEETKGKITSANAVLWSPNELKVLFKTEDKVEVYDLKKDKTHVIENANKIGWYPDSNHLIQVENELISIVEWDGQNKTSIYSGSFDAEAVFPWPDGSQLIILTSFNKSSPANLYSISLR